MLLSIILFSIFIFIEILSAIISFNTLITRKSKCNDLFKIFSIVKQVLVVQRLNNTQVVNHLSVYISYFENNIIDTSFYDIAKKTFLKKKYFVKS
jgi:hypothetical protein